MGRIFETRKYTMFARWDRMAKQFARISKEIAIALKSGGSDPASNPGLRRVMHNARSVNMPKDKVEAAIRRASGQDAVAYSEVLYEGYGPHGVALIVETATDNPTRTVANVRSHFKAAGCTVGTSGSVAFQFRHMGVFRLDPKGIDSDELELALIDEGLDEMVEGLGDKGERQLIVRTAFGDLGRMHRALEARGLHAVSASSEYVSSALLELPEDQAKEVLSLIDALEQDDDVQRVFHTLA